MKEEINKEGLKQFNHDGAIFAILLIVFVVSVVPLTVFFNWYGLIFALGIWGISMRYATRLEKYKKEHDIQSYKEIVAFTEGKKLDEIEKAQEFGKRPYQKVLSVVISASIALVVCLLFVWIFRSWIF